MYIKITLSRWSGKSTCKSSTEIDTALSGLSLRLGMTDYYRLNISDNRNLYLIIEIEIAVSFILIGYNFLILYILFIISFFIKKDTINLASMLILEVNTYSNKYF